MSYTVTIFGLTLNINSVAFTLPILGGWKIYWYGIIIATGFLLAIIYAMTNAKRYNIDTDRMLDAILVTTPVAVLSARLYYAIFDSAHSIKNIKDFFGIGTAEGFSGLAIYGGVIGAFAAGFIMCKIRKINVLDMFDLTAIGFLIGQAIGRWGNFTNQEAFGSPTGSSWWGMSSSATGNVLVHPCFLYESVWCLIGFIILHNISKKRKFSGEISLCYLAWYGLGRAFIEPLRTDSLYIGIIKVSFLLSLILFISATVTLTVLLVKYNKKSKQSVYVPMFEQEINELTEENSAEEKTEETEETVSDINDNTENSAEEENE